MDPYIQRLENKALKHLVVDGAGRVPIDHADEIKTANYYVGGWLVAKKPVEIMSAAGIIYFLPNKNNPTPTRAIAPTINNTVF